MFNKKGVLLNTFFIENFTKLTGKHLRPSPTQVFYCQFFEIFENTFLNRTLPGNCFSWIALMVKNVNYVSLIFPNSQLYHGLPEWWLLFQYNEKHYVIKKAWPNFKSQTLSMTLFQKQSRGMFKVVFIIFPKPTGKYLCKILCVGISFW